MSVGVHGCAVHECMFVCVVDVCFCERASVSVVCVWVGVCVTVVPAQFMEHLPTVYPLMVELSRCGSRDVRRVLHPLFEKRISKLLPGSIDGSLRVTPK